MDCIFCNIAKKVIPSRIIAETNNSIAFLDALPLSRGHTLVIPKLHYEKVQDMSEVDNTDLFNTSGGIQNCPPAIPNLNTVFAGPS